MIDPILDTSGILIDSIDTAFEECASDAASINPPGIPEPFAAVEQHEDEIAQYAKSKR